MKNKRQKLHILKGKKCSKNANIIFENVETCKKGEIGHVPIHNLNLHALDHYPGG